MYMKNIFNKYSECNTFQVISDLVHDFINFNTLKFISKIHKKTRGMLLLTKAKDP